MCTMLHEDMMCLVPVAVTEHQSLFKAAGQAGGSFDLVCYTCFLWLHCYPRLYRGAIQMFMRVVQNLDFQSGLKYLKGTEEISADVRNAEIETFHFMCLLCMTYLLIHCYFSYRLWPSEGLMSSDLGSASAIKTSLALSYLLGGGSCIDGKSSLTAAVWPHEGYLWLLLAQGSALMTLHDHWQEVFNTRGMQMAWWHEQYPDTVKENTLWSWKDLWRHLCVRRDSSAATLAFSSSWWDPAGSYVCGFYCLCL